MEERSGWGGEPCGPRGEGNSIGTSAKLMERLVFLEGSCAWPGRRELGNTGLGNSMGDAVGDSDGEGCVYMELDCSECAWPMIGESFSAGCGGLEGNAASRRGSHIERAEPGVVGIATLDLLLFWVWKMLPSPSLELLLSMLNALLLSMDGSMVSRGSSEWSWRGLASCTLSDHSS
jgi:hypothetical protein